VPAPEVGFVTVLVVVTPDLEVDQVDQVFVPAFWKRTSMSKTNPETARDAHFTVKLVVVVPAVGETIRGTTTDPVSFESPAAVELYAYVPAAMNT
jgi:hypothetical protein